MGCYPCTIKRETNFYQQKQGCPHDYRGYPHVHIDFTDKNTKKRLCTRVFSGSATGGHLLPPSIPIGGGGTFKGLKINLKALIGYVKTLMGNRKELKGVEDAPNATKRG